MSEFYEYELSKNDFELLDKALGIALTAAPHVSGSRPDIRNLREQFRRAFSGTLYFEKDHRI